MELLIMLTVGGRKCALRALKVHSVMEIDSITPVPMGPSHVLGLSTRRSHTLTVIDCLRSAGLEGQSDPTGKRAAVVEHDGHTYALLVDSIEDVEDASGEVVEITGGYGPEWSRLAEGLVETRSGPALLLDVAALVAGPQKMSVAA